MKSLFICSILFIALSGCTINNSPEFDLSKTKNIIVGQSTKENVIEILGKEYDDSSYDGLEEMSYEYKSSLETALLAPQNITEDKVVVVLKDDIVIDKYISRQNSSMMCLGNMCSQDFDTTKIPLE